MAGRNGAKSPCARCDCDDYERSAKRKLGTMTTRIKVAIWLMLIGASIVYLSLHLGSPQDPPGRGEPGWELPALSEGPTVDVVQVHGGIWRIIDHETGITCYYTAATNYPTHTACAPISTD